MCARDSFATPSKAKAAMPQPTVPRGGPGTHGQPAQIGQRGPVDAYHRARRTQSDPYLERFASLGRQASLLQYPWDVSGRHDRSRGNRGRTHIEEDEDDIVVLAHSARPRNSVVEHGRDLGRRRALGALVRHLHRRTGVKQKGALNRPPCTSHTCCKLGRRR